MAAMEAALELDATLPRSVARVEQHGVEAVAVCFLHSYVNPRARERGGRMAREHFPALTVSASSAVFPFMREYERWTTACLNAYVQPIVHRYLTRLETGLAGIGFRGQFLVMSSSGGTLTAEIARRFPIRLLESGPAAGALMSGAHGRALGALNVLSFDMGGTTAKGCIIHDGAPLKRYELEVARMHEFKSGSGLPAKIPVIDMIEIGAGGGSMAEIDERGALRVGPRSAGARSGPGLLRPGGAHADADRCQPAARLSRLGVVPRRHAWRSTRRAAGADGCRGREPAWRRTSLRAAWGIHEVINEDVARAFRVHASERGVDFRHCSMIVFGGSGPLHGARVARKLQIPRVICPRGAGVMSAFGLLDQPAWLRALPARGACRCRAHRPAACSDLGRDGRRSRRSFSRCGCGDGRCAARAMRWTCATRARATRSTCRCPRTSIRWPFYAALPRLFATRYRAVFGLVFAERGIEIVNWKVEAHGPRPGADVDVSPEAVATAQRRGEGSSPGLLPGCRRHRAMSRLRSLRAASRRIDRGSRADRGARVDVRRRRLATGRRSTIALNLVIEVVGALQ